MKKFLTLLLTFSLVVLLSQASYAAGTGKGNLRIHLQQWEDDYSDNLGSHAWGDGIGIDGTAGHTGIDDFGAYWEFNDLNVGDEGTIGFIAVEWVGGSKGSWPAEGARERRTGDVEIPQSVLIEGETVDVYIFEGANSKAMDNPYFVAKADAYNVMLVFANPASVYSEELGLHGWNWEGEGWGVWASPNLVLTEIANYGSIKPLMGVMMHAAADAPMNDAGTALNTGFILYEGTDASKRTGDVKEFLTEDDLGKVVFKYVVDVGAGATHNNNVYDDKDAFVEEAFTFRLVDHTIDAATREGLGTYAVNPTQIKVELSSVVESPYAAAKTEAEQTAALEEIQGWFEVKEILTENEETGEKTYGPALELDRVDFSTSAATLNQFVVILKDSNKLNPAKKYQIFFDSIVITESVEVVPATDADEKAIDVKFRVTVPADTPAEAVINIAGSLTDWSHQPLTKVDGQDNVWEFVHPMTLTSTYQVLEFKFTRGEWPNEELVTENRKFAVMHSGASEQVVEVTVVGWADLNDEENPTEKAVPAPLTLETQIKTTADGFEASLALSIDDEAPVLTFIAAALNRPADQRIIEVEWGKAFNTALFPRYNVTDNRDGVLTQYVYVPKGANSVLDTRTEGDYVIMLEVSDLWGNVTQETFIFRVVKK